MNEFFCIAGGSNLNAGSRDGSSTVPGTTPNHEYASGNYVQSTGVFTVASGDPSSDGVQVGDYASIYADGSTETDFVGKVTAVSSTTITVDTSTNYHGTNPTDGTGNRTLRIGGAWAGPSGSVAFPFASGWIRYQFVLSSAKPRVNVRNDVAPSDLAVTLHVSRSICIEGFASTVGDNGSPPVFTWTGAVDGWSLFGFTGCKIANMHAKTTNGGTYDGIRDSSLFGGYVERCISEGWLGFGYEFNVNGWQVLRTRNVAINCGTGFKSVNQVPVVMSIAIDCTTGFQAPHLAYCVASGCTTGFAKHQNSGELAVHCDAYDCTTGFNMGNAQYVNCNAVKCSGTGFENGSIYDFDLWGCGVGGGAFANGTNYDTSRGDEKSPLVEYQTHPWVDPDNSDFRMDITKLLSDGVTSVANAGYSVLGNNYNGNTGAPSIGAVPLAGAGGGLLRVGMSGGFGG